MTAGKNFAKRELVPNMNCEQEDDNICPQGKGLGYDDCARRLQHILRIRGKGIPRGTSGQARMRTVKQ